MNSTTTTVLKASRDFGNFLMILSCFASLQGLIKVSQPKKGILLFQTTAGCSGCLFGTSTVSIKAAIL